MAFIWQNHIVIKVNIRILISLQFNEILFWQKEFHYFAEGIWNPESECAAHYTLIDRQFVSHFELKNISTHCMFTLASIPYSVENRCSIDEFSILFYSFFFLFLWEKVERKIWNEFSTIIRRYLDRQLKNVMKNLKCNTFVHFYHFFFHK